MHTFTLTIVSSFISTFLHQNLVHPLLDLVNSNPQLHLFELGLQQWFGQNVCRLIPSSYKLDFNSLLCSTLLNKMIPNPDMLAVAMMNWVFDQIDH
jgi:hypothetical protein